MRLPIIAIISALVVAEVKGDGFTVDLGKFTQELQRSEQDGARVTLIWWIPSEFWRESFRKQAMTDEQRDQFINAVDDYIIVAVVDGVLSPVGNSKWRDDEEIRDNLAIRIGGERRLLPLDPDSISVRTYSLLLAMKPMFGNMLGDFGKGLEMVCFKGKDLAGKRLIDPVEKGQLTVIYDGKEYKWRLPLGTLLPPKYDAESGEAFPGNYDFNPFTGKPLTNAAPAQAGDDERE